MTEQKPALFKLGRIVATPGALALLARNAQTPEPYIYRHSRGDWGTVATMDAGLNDAAVKNRARVLSVYHLGPDRLWVLTEADRSATTLLLPEEY